MALDMNPYFDDSKLFFRNTAKLVSEAMDKATLISAAMLFALAMERVLKGILFEVNPVYVLTKPEFKNSIAVSYGGKILNRTAEVSKDPDADVITFRASLLRAEVLSNFVKDNKSLLYFTCECRDVIAHNELSLLDLPKIESLMKRDFFQVAKQFSALHGIPLRGLLANRETKISLLSASLQGTVEGKVETLLFTHQNKWQILCGTAGYVGDKDRVTREVLASPGKTACTCPACGNTAIIYQKFEKAIDEHDVETIGGAFIAKVKCFYCKLDIKDYDEIAYLEKKIGLQALVDLRETGVRVELTKEGSP